MNFPRTTGSKPTGAFSGRCNLAADDHRRHFENTASRNLWCSVTDNAGNKESVVLPRLRKMAAKGTMKASSELLFLLGLLSFCVIVCPWNGFREIFKMAA